MPFSNVFFSIQKQQPSVISQVQIKYTLCNNDYNRDPFTNLLTGSECTSAAFVITFIQDSISLAVSEQK